VERRKKEGESESEERERKKREEGREKGEGKRENREEMDLMVNKAERRVGWGGGEWGRRGCVQE
jgi:hypothetical protein